MRRDGVKEARVVRNRIERFIVMDGNVRDG